MTKRRGLTANRSKLLSLMVVGVFGLGLPATALALGLRAVARSRSRPSVPVSHASSGALRIALAASCERESMNRDAL